MNGSDSDDDHCSEPMSTGKSHDRREAPLEPQETFGRRVASTCSAALRWSAIEVVELLVCYLAPVTLLAFSVRRRGALLDLARRFAR